MPEISLWRCQYRWAIAIWFSCALSEYRCCPPSKGEWWGIDFKGLHTGCKLFLNHRPLQPHGITNSSLRNACCCVMGNVYLSTPHWQLHDDNSCGYPISWTCIQRGQLLSLCSWRHPATWVPVLAQSKPSVELILLPHSPAAGTPLQHLWTPSCHHTPFPIVLCETLPVSQHSDLGRPPVELGQNWKQPSLQAEKQLGQTLHIHSVSVKKDEECSFSLAVLHRMLWLHCLWIHSTVETLIEGPESICSSRKLDGS